MSTWAVFWICVAVIFVGVHLASAYEEKWKSQTMKWKYLHLKEKNNGGSQTKEETRKLP